MNITVKKDRSKLLFSKTDGKTAIYDLADQQCYNYQGRKVKSLNSFFANYRMYDLEWEDQNYRKFIKTVESNTRFSSIGTLLTNLHDFRHNEGYILLGLPVNSRMHKPISEYPKSVRKFLVNKYVTNPNLTNRYSHSYDCVRWLQYFSEDSVDKLRFVELISKLDFTDAFNDLGAYDINQIFGMAKDYNMDLKSLLLKINEYIQREGLTLDSTLRNLSDYNRMAKAMSAKYQKYPKYLLSTHQIVIRNFNAFRETYEEQAFLNQIDKSLAHKGVTYSVLIAEKSQDVKNEGANQHHCVASYVRSIINGKTQIVFMRNNQQLDNPLLTLEVNNGKVQQAKGAYNRNPSEDELKFIHTYAKSHDLGVSDYL